MRFTEDEPLTLCGDRCPSDGMVHGDDTFEDGGEVLPQLGETVNDNDTGSG